MASKKVILTKFAIYQRLLPMHIGKNIKKIREQKGILQKEVATTAGIHASNYSKIEKGEREPSIEALDKIAKLFGMTVDEIIHYEGKVPKEVKLKDKSTPEKLQLIDQLDDEDKQAIFRIIDGMITKAKFKTFFQQHAGVV